MLETELFLLLEGTADAAYTVTAEGEIRSWNAAAERLFGYAAREVIGRNVDDVLQARDALGTRALGGADEAGTRPAKVPDAGVPDFDLEVRTRDGSARWVNVSTIVFRNARTGRHLFVRLARDIGPRKRREVLAERMLALAKEVVAGDGDSAAHAPVAELSERERDVLRLFAAGKNATAVARALRISRQTLRNHLHHINRKLRTHDRLEAVTHAIRRKLID